MASNESILVKEDYTNSFLPHELRFWIILSFNTLSLVCSLFQLYHLCTKRALRTALNNHSIIALLCTGLSSQLIDIPFYVVYIRLGYVWPSTPFFCRFWWYVDMEALEVTVFLVLWTSLERHMLIFHDRWFVTAKKRWLLHYLPLIFFIAYPLLFYLIILLFVTCDYPASYDYTQPWCYYSPICYNDIILVRYDILANWTVCATLKLLSDVALIGRFIWHRRIRLHQPVQWRKHRKMFLQLMSISMLTSSFSMPLLIFYLLVNFANLSTNINPNLELSLLYLLLCSILCLPFVMLLSFPKKYWLDKWKTLLCERRRPPSRQIAPARIFPPS
ncbi:unnamed protein product [Adineta ricciae]|uniref:G-protein coupled receptors family 1 profile domain-containing protein n=1 Tax=Adineta ricciae TaxID=249248 RepID=A0A815SEG4_ADIRI|nr:unnamed protein product [Adineta ricciae]CAF1489517.1 unnamed protein product [Adineta ricciae]